MMRNSDLGLREIKIKDEKLIFRGLRGCVFFRECIVQITLPHLHDFSRFYMQHAMPSVGLI